jgi:hypothetical protein
MGCMMALSYLCDSLAQRRVQTVLLGRVKILIGAAWGKCLDFFHLEFLDFNWHKQNCLEER